MGLIPFSYTWAYFYGNITSLNNFPSVGIWKSTYFINPYHHDLPQLKKKFLFPRHTLSLVRPYTNTQMHTFVARLRVPPHTYFLLNCVLTPIVEDSAGLHYAPTWVCLGEKMVTLTELVSFYLFLISMLLRWLFQEQCWYYL